VERPTIFDLSLTKIHILTPLTISINGLPILQKWAQKSGFALLEIPGPEWNQVYKHNNIRPKPQTYIFTPFPPHTRNASFFTTSSFIVLRSDRYYNIAITRLRLTNWQMPSLRPSAIVLSYQKTQEGEREGTWLSASRFHAVRHCLRRHFFTEYKTCILRLAYVAHWKLILAPDI
jgi:hypothetical protein